MEAAAHITGLSEETLQTVAHMIVEAKSVCILWAMGVTQHSQGSDTSTAISNLLLITGTICDREPGLIPCVVTTMCRERATTARCRMIFRDTSRPMIPKFGHGLKRRGTCLFLPPQVLITTKWWKPFMPASSKPCT